MAEEPISVVKLIDIIHARGGDVVLRPDGEVVLRGLRDQATPALLQVVQKRRLELIEYALNECRKLDAATLRARAERFAEAALASSQPNVERLLPGPRRQAPVAVGVRQQTLWQPDGGVQVQQVQLV